MASPQAENGHVDIANEIIEALAKRIISPDEWRCLMVIFRKTWGWHKKQDRISLSQFALMTGMRKTHVSRAVSKLEKRNIIDRPENRVTQTGNPKGLLYRIQKDFDKWMGLPKRVTVTRSGNESLPKQVTTKENIQKKKTLRDLPDPAVKELQIHFHEKYRERLSQPYKPTWGKEGKLFKDLLKTHPRERLKEMMTIFFKSEDPFIKNSGYTIGVFCSQINKLAAVKVSRW